VTPCGLVGVYQHLEEHAVLIVRAIYVWPRVTEVLSAVLNTAMMRPCLKLYNTKQCTSAQLLYYSG